MIPTPVELSRLVKDAATVVGFDRCGIARAESLPRGDFLAEWLGRGYAGTMGYLHRHQDSRRDVRTWLPWAKSVIVVALNYGQKPPPKPVDEPRGRVAMYAWGEDYHVVLREKLEGLVARIQSFHPNFQFKICVDTSAILEREWAAAAGIGWIGKNTLVMHESLGSFFFLGEIITDLDLVPDAPATDHCGTCTRCLDACPTQAFPQPYVMDARRCISYLTIEHRSEIDPALAANMSDWVYGCDICQDVCPHNRAVPETSEPRFKSPESAYPALSEIAAWDEDSYRRATQGKATDRARLDMWKRNAAIIADYPHNSLLND